MCWFWPCFCYFWYNNSVTWWWRWSSALVTVGRLAAGVGDVDPRLLQPGEDHGTVDVARLRREVQVSVRVQSWSASSPPAAPSSSSRSRDGSSDRHPHHRRFRSSVQSDDVARTRPGHAGHTRARSGTGTSETETIDGQSRQSFTRDIGRMFTQTCTSPGTAGLSSPWPSPSPKKTESQHSIDY